jgi:hypothetical protein
MLLGLGASLAGALLFAVAPDVWWVFAGRAFIGENDWCIGVVDYRRQGLVSWAWWRHECFSCGLQSDCTRPLYA